MNRDGLITQGVSQRIVFNGPFRAGFALDPRKILVDGYSQLQDGLLQAAREKLSGDLTIAGSIGRPSGMKIDVDSRRGVTLTPRYLIERSLDGAVLQAELDRLAVSVSISAFDVDAASSSTFKISRVVIRLCDFGFGAVLVEGEFVPGADLSVIQYRDTVERLSSAMTKFNPLIQDTSMVVEQCVSSKYLAMLPDSKDEMEAVQKWDQIKFGHCELLWIHRIFLLAARDQDEFARFGALAKLLVFRHAADGPINQSLRDDMVVYVGAGNSAAVHLSTTPNLDICLLQRTIQMQNIIWARAALFDADLFFSTNSLSRQAGVRDISTAKKIYQLEHRSDEIVDLLETVALFRSVVEDYVYHLDPQSLVIWKGLADCWGTNNRFDAIERKLGFLERLYDRTRATLRSLYDSQLSFLVFAFTAAGFFSVFVDVVTFIQGEGLHGPDWLRLSILIGMFVSILALLFRIFRRRTSL